MQTSVSCSGKRIVRTIENGGFTQKQLAVLCATVLVVLMIPLFAIAFYNYPADDDFSHTYTTVVTWVNTGSLQETIHTAFEHIIEEYETWNGDYTQFLISVATPMIFGIQYYFLSNWFVLLFICLSVGYGLKSALVHLLKTSKAAFYIIYTMVISIILQYMPSIAEGVYWHCGSPYVVTWFLIPIMLGLLIRLRNPQNAFRKGYRILLLIITAILSGGSTFPVVISTFVLLAFITGSAFISKWKNRWYVALAFVVFLSGLIVSITAPGNAIRQEWLGETNGILYTLITAVLESCDLVGEWFSLIIISLFMLIVPILWKPMKESSFQFKYPALVAVMLFGVFSSSLTPGIYTNFGYEANRYINPVYFSFLLFAFGTVLYTEGALIRLLERRKERGAAKHLLAATETMGQRFSYLYLLVVVIVLLFGSFGNTIMNTSSISAAKSLITGEAAAFREAMAERQEYILETDSDETAVTSLTVTKPYVFKDDKLPFQGIYGTVRYMKWYFELFEETI